ncbi:rod-binding protein [Temperatibacter marinus]|uniref:Rod-binding protein n=1 Tax=Temperatibacter marinus TaxID=1456591 RepID=A0AA52H8A0_9PROT|nr:rod-binding protein [Temperatibacter marinus]WND01911.1 rod-binding protein [Temperatibacter marinus]
MTDISTVTQSGLASEMLLKGQIQQAKASITGVKGEDISPELDKKIRKVAESFEAMFISQLLQPMFQDIPVDETMGGGSGEQMFRGMMVEQMGKSMASGGGIGLSDSIYSEILKMQEVAS